LNASVRWAWDRAVCESREGEEKERRAVTEPEPRLSRHVEPPSGPPSSSRGGAAGLASLFEASSFCSVCACSLLPVAPLPSLTLRPEGSGL
jgi:hypothetical protein